MTARRKYRRLSPDQWTVIETEWASGSYTIEDLAARHGVSARSVAGHMAAAGIKKGSAFDETARAAIGSRVLKSIYGAAESRLERAEISRKSTFETAALLEAALCVTARKLAEDPASAQQQLPVLRGIDIAVAALDRLHGIKSTALGVKADDLDETELPQIIIRDLGDEQLAELKREGAMANDDYGMD